jgi:hypothetical protein
MKATSKQTKTVGQNFPVIRYVKQTAAQKKAIQKMLASPCPYCLDPKKFQRELKEKGHLDHTGGIARVGKFWKRGDTPGMLTVDSYDCGDYFYIPISNEHFIPRFNDFNLSIISFESQYSPWTYASDNALFIFSAAPSDLTRGHKFGLNVARVAHKKSSVVVDSHTWFSHGTILTVHHVPKELSSTDVTVMQEALEFFRPETRGAPKFNTVNLVRAIQKLGEKATQAAVAKELGVTPQALRAWANRSNLKNWEQVINRYGKTELW